MKALDLLSRPIEKAKEIYNTYIGKHINSSVSTFVDQSASRSTETAAADPRTPEEIAADEQRKLIVTIVISTILNVFSIIIASLVTNHMIMYPIAMRAIAFPATLLGCILNPLLLMGLIAYYFIFAMTRFYFNIGKDPVEKHPLMPFIYTLWPLSTQRYETTLMYILTFPFVYYPRDEEVSFTNTYVSFMENVRASFPNFNETMKIGGFSSLYNTFKNTLNERHTYTTTDATGQITTNMPISKDVIERT